MALHQERKVDLFKYAPLYEICQVSKDKSIFVVFHAIVCLLIEHLILGASWTVIEKRKDTVIKKLEKEKKNCFAHEFNMFQPYFV